MRHSSVFGRQRCLPEFHPLITTDPPEFFDFRYLIDRHYRNTLWHDIPEKDAYHEMSRDEFETHWQKASKDSNYRYQAVIRHVRIPEVPEIVRQRGFAVIHPTVYNGRVLVVFSRLGDEGNGFYQTGMPHDHTAAEKFFDDDPRATAQDFLDHIHRKKRFSILAGWLWKISDSLPYCRLNGELFCYRYLQLH